MREVNYNIIQGDNFRLALTYTDPTGTPIDLSGYSVVMEVRDRPGSKNLFASATYIPASGSVAAVSDGITVTSASGLINVDLSPTKTKNFNIPKSAYQIQITSGGGIKTTVLNGWFNVNAGVID